MELLEKDATATAVTAVHTPETLTEELIADQATDLSSAAIPTTIDTVFERMRQIAGSDSDVDTDEIARLKQQFYALRNDALATARQAFIEAGGDPQDFTPGNEADEETFKQLMAAVKEKKAAIRARIEAEQAENLRKKQAIIDELRQMGADTDNVNRHYPRAKELQAEFKIIGEVPQQNATEIWKTFQDAVETFYDQWKVNKELRDYDFKKNLAEKQLILTEARALAEEPDPVVAFRRLQELHDKWRQTGPVAKEIREEIWAQFKDASAEVNKRYQTFFEERKQREAENEAAKADLCAQAEAIIAAPLESYAAWNKATREVLDIQQKWKSLGYASRRANNALFARFRTACDKFFADKAAFFTSMKDELSRNLEAKTALCEQAEALKDSTDWRKTTDTLVELQRRWKTIGTVPKRHSDAIWKRFTEACDYFFEQKKHATTDVRRTEQANLRTKRDIVRQLQELNAPDCPTPRKEAIDTINTLRAQWQNTGHVPFRDKDKLHDLYRETVRQLFDRYDINENRARMESFQTDIETMSADPARLSRERERMARIYENRRAELKTYENNLSFLTAKSKSGNSMINELERNILRLKANIADLEQRIKLIDEKL